MTFLVFTCSCNNVKIITLISGYDRRHFRNNDFQLPFERTPEQVILKVSFNGISIDKEIAFDCKIDILPKWKAFKKEKGLR